MDKRQTIKLRKIEIVKNEKIGLHSSITSSHSSFRYVAISAIEFAFLRNPK